jgi:3-isopropylmalate/(R)-2-methylmalate dehydratase small subunit
MGHTGNHQHSFADIFRNNALKNGLLPVMVDPETHRKLIDMAAEQGCVEVTVDLAAQKLSLPDGEAVDFPIDLFSKKCLLEGVDSLGYLLQHDQDRRLTNIRISFPK